MSCIEASSFNMATACRTIFFKPVRVCIFQLKIAVVLSFLKDFLKRFSQFFLSGYFFSIANEYNFFRETATTIFQPKIANFPEFLCTALSTKKVQKNSVP